MMQQPFFYETRIRFIDTDASGRIHYTAMFRYFEAAEIEFMRVLDVSYRGPHFAFPRVHVECGYRLALAYDDLISIEVCLTQLGASSVRLEFQTYKDGKLAANGAVLMVCMDIQKQRAIGIPKHLREKLKLVIVPSKQRPA